MNWIKYLTFFLLGVIVIITTSLVIKNRRKQVIDLITLTEKSPMVDATKNIENKQVKFRGWLTTVWGDGFKDGSGKSMTIYTISNGTQSYKLQTQDNLFKYDRKEVIVTGIKTEDLDTIKVISIQSAPSQ